MLPPHARSVHAHTDACSQLTQCQITLSSDILSPPHQLSKVEAEYAAAVAAGPALAPGQEPDLDMRVLMVDGDEVISDSQVRGRALSLQLPYTLPPYLHHPPPPYPRSTVIGRGPQGAHAGLTAVHHSYACRVHTGAHSLIYMQGSHSRASLICMQGSHRRTSLICMQGSHSRASLICVQGSHSHTSFICVQGWPGCVTQLGGCIHGWMAARH